MWVFWPIVRLFKNSNEYDDVNEEGIRSIFPYAGVVLTVSAAQVYQIEFWWIAKNYGVGR